MWPSTVWQTPEGVEGDGAHPSPLVDPQKTCLSFPASFSSGATTHETRSCRYQALSYLRAFVNAAFSTPSALPQPLPLVLGEPSPCPPDVSFCALLLAAYVPVPQSPVNSTRACPSSHPPSLIYCGYLIKSSNQFSA